MIEARFTCARCGREAAHVRLVARGAPEAIAGNLPMLVVDAGRLSSQIGTAAAANLDTIRALADADAPALFGIDPEFAPFWCPTCRAAYCADEWRTWDVWDDEAPEFWEELRGVCPNGHERWIYD